MTRETEEAVMMLLVDEAMGGINVALADAIASFILQGLGGSDGRDKSIRRLTVSLE